MKKEELERLWVKTPLLGNRKTVEAVVALEEGEHSRGKPLAQHSSAPLPLMPLHPTTIAAHLRIPRPPLRALLRLNMPYFQNESFLFVEEEEFLLS